jgi:hypothetical protein
VHCASGTPSITSKAVFSSKPCVEYNKVPFGSQSAQRCSAVARLGTWLSSWQEHRGCHGPNGLSSFRIFPSGFNVRTPILRLQRTEAQNSNNTQCETAARRPCFWGVQACGQRAFLCGRPAFPDDRPRAANSQQSFQPSSKNARMHRAPGRHAF